MTIFHRILDRLPRFAYDQVMDNATVRALVMAISDEFEEQRQAIQKLEQRIAEAEEKR